MEALLGIYSSSDMWESFSILAERELQEHEKKNCKMIDNCGLSILKLIHFCPSYSAVNFRELVFPIKDF